MYYLLGAGPRSPNRLPPRPGDVQLCQKKNGPAVLTRTRNTSNVRSTTQRGVGNTNRLCRIRIQHLDQRQHLGSNRLDVLQTGHPNEQRRGRLAQWPKSPSFWKSTTAHVPPNPASLQGSETDSDPDPPGIREEAATNPATKV